MDVPGFAETMEQIESALKLRESPNPRLWHGLANFTISPFASAWSRDWPAALPDPHE